MMKVFNTVVEFVGISIILIIGIFVMAIELVVGEDT